MFSCIILSSVLILHHNLFAFENNGRGTKAIGMANAFAAVSDNCWAINYNPAGLVRLTSLQCSAFIVPEQFGLKELRTTAFAAGVPLSIGSFGITAEKFGFELYAESDYALAYAANVEKYISAGVSIEYHRVDIARYGTSSGIIFNGGIIAQVFDKVSAGFSIHNMTGAVLGNTHEKLPQECMLGVCWSIHRGLQLSIELEKEIRFPASIKMGVEQIVFDAIALRAGAADNPDKYSVGIAVGYSLFEFGYAGYSHPDLGWTHQIELSVKWDK
ncbi:MAG: hypothetical protein EHM64_12105 [Ignavibacteriae bacterium]|nr:MAG: hypothetical protein EHM64_12105 [Ignavibacteriota bacterium]